MTLDELCEPFINLFGGFEDSQRIGAFGTGRGQWVKKPLCRTDVVCHLKGEGPGIGVPPLRPDNTVVFAAIDLDEPDFEAAQDMQRFIPGTSWVERSRSGNAHVWVFFSEPIEAWLPRAILREACESADKEHVEVFPKNHDFARVKLGNYINLPYHGSKRWIVEPTTLHTSGLFGIGPETFVSAAHEYRNDPDEWRKRARWLMLEPPGSRPTSGASFGERETIHPCFHYIVDNALDGTNPIMPGHRSIVFFNLAKMLVNWKHYEGADVLYEVNQKSPYPIPASELHRIIANAERGQYTSTGCDDPVMAPYVDPDCHILRRS